MIKNLSEVAAQLRELAEVLNTFKSEAVQLRIVELLLAEGSGADESNLDTGQDDKKTPEVSKRKRRAAKKQKPGGTGDDDKEVASGRNSGRPGPKAMLEKLIQSGYFKAARTKKDVMDHCSGKLAHHYQPGEIAVSLTRLIREQKLDREKNAEDQYTYVAK